MAGLGDEVSSSRRLWVLLTRLPLERPGVSVDQLLAWLEREDTESGRRSMQRDVAGLRAAGVNIVNVADAGKAAEYVWVRGGERARGLFSEDEWEQLSRAVEYDERVAAPQLVSRYGSADDVLRYVDAVQRAVETRSVLTFQYNGHGRVVDPLVIHPGLQEWWVTGVDRDVMSERTFNLARMSDVAVGLPGSADSYGDVVVTATANPLSWQVDDEVTARVRFSAEFADDVRLLLELGEVPAADDDGVVVMDVNVVHRRAFFSRLMELGERIYLVGPDSVREDLSDLLMATVGGSHVN